MRVRLTALACAAVLLPAAALAASPPPPEAEPGLAVVRSHLKVEKGVNFRKVKLNADGDVCGYVSLGASGDMEFMAFKSTGVVWINEAEGEPYSLFNYGDPGVKRSKERSDYQAWKTCAKG